MHRPVPHNMVKRPIHRLKDGVPFPELDELADESIITITNDGKNVVRLLASPFDLGDLAIGHIICEGRGTVTDLDVRGFEVLLEGDITARPNDDILTASCGACTTGDIEIPHGNVDITVSINADMNRIMTEMRKKQPWFESTGGMHAAALFNENGDLLLIREDIGRHNAFDKVVGAAIRNDITPKIIVLSSRIGWELVAKATRTEIEIIIAAGAISSAAEHLARRVGITLVGFAGSKSPAIIGNMSRIIDKPPRIP